MFCLGRWANSASSQGNTRALGMGRVMSLKTITTRSERATISRRGGEAMGLRKAARRLAPSSAKPGLSWGSTTVASSGASMANP